MILDQAFKYITELKRQNDELLLNGGSSEQGGDLRALLSPVCVAVTCTEDMECSPASLRIGLPSSLARE